MKAEDLKRTVKRAKEKATLKTKQKPNLLSDNGSCYVSSELKDYPKNIQKMKHIIGKPLQPQTQRKIERYHRTIKT